MRNVAMEWRRLLLCAAGCLLWPASAMVGMAESKTPPGMVVAVAGDVVRPDCYECSDSQNLVLRDALLAAGLAGESSQVTVYRAQYNAGSTTELVTRSAVEAGVLLRPGDVIIVRLISAPDQMVRPNAVIQSGHRPVILALQGDRIAFGDVVCQLQLPPELAGKALRISSGTPMNRSSLSFADLVAHGDVVQCLPSAGRPPTNARGFAPAVSEWKSDNRSVSERPVQTDMPNSILQQDRVADPDGQRETLYVPSGDQGEQISAAQVMNSDRTAGSSELVSHLESSQRAAEYTQGDAMRWEQSPSGRSDSPFQLLGTGDTDAEATPAVTVADSSGLTETMVESSGEVAPIPPEESLIRGEASSWEGRFWQLTFGVILFIAGGLVASQKKNEAPDSAQITKFTGGRVVAEPSAEILSAAVGKVSLKDSERRSASEVQGESASPGNESRSSSAAVASVTDELEREKPRRVLQSERGNPSPQRTPLVTEQEWYGGDWLRKTGVTECAAVRTESVVQVDDRAVSSQAHIQLDEWSLKATGSKGNGGSDEKAFADELQDLNDLIENRLPVDLTTAELPLRVTLFGRPAGPRRLRIDAAHPALSGPHLSMGQERRRGVFSKPAVSATSAEKNSGSGADVSGAEAGAGFTQSLSADDSFDRALTFLQRQEER
jgi:hypothetical protein